MQTNLTVNKVRNQALCEFIILYLTVLMYNNHTMTKLMSLKTKTTVAAALVKTLLKLDVDSIFGYPGASVLSIYNELSSESKIKHYLVRHEQAAVHAAEGYARVSGKTGVVLVTSGPGFTNTITGIANAYADSTPLVILAGQVTKADKKGKIFQNVDIASIVKTCSKKVFTVTQNDDIEEVLENAFLEANSGIKGPVVVILPRNILESEYKAKRKTFYEIKPDVCDFAQKIPALIELFNSSQKPLILIGGGCINAPLEIERLVSKLQCPVVSTLMGIGIYPAENNLYLGMIGLNGNEIANAALNSCDLLIALGTSLSDRSTCKNKNFTKEFKTVYVNLEEPSKSVDVEIIADVKDFLNIFLANPDNIISKSKKLLVEIDALKDSYTIHQDNSTTLHSSYVLETLSEFTKYYEPVVVTDVGQHQMLTAQFFNFNKPRKFITSGGLGTMGFGLPASIGAHIANPKNLILNITGDGSFQMNLQELATCREHHIPIKIIIMNNSFLGMVRELQEKIYNKRYQVEMINPDFTKIAEAYDLFAIRVTKKEELIPALEKAIDHDGTAIIDIVIDSFENI